MCFFALIIFASSLVSTCISTSIMASPEGTNSVTVGGNDSVLLSSNGFEGVIDTVTISRAIDMVTISPSTKFTVYIKACDINALSTQKLLLPPVLVTTQAITYSRVSLNYYSGDIPLYTIGNGSITYTVNGGIVHQESCLIRIFLFTDLSNYTSSSASYDAIAEFCIYHSIEQGTVSTSTIPLNSTGFYFIAAIVSTFSEINMTTNLTANNITIETGHTKMCSQQQTSCSIDISAYEGTTYVQSEQYQYSTSSVTSIRSLFFKVLSVTLGLAIGLFLLIQFVRTCSKVAHFRRQHDTCSRQMRYEHLMEIDTGGQVTGTCDVHLKFSISNEITLREMLCHLHSDTETTVQITETEITDKHLLSCSTGNEVSISKQSNIQFGSTLRSDDVQSRVLHLLDQPTNLDQSQNDVHNMKSNFGAPKEMTVDSTGLIHHCSQYGVTLIIPEGAVQQSATVWFGACLFSDKFLFEGDYVPVSPIVWVYIDQVLLKPAELYIPHHIDLSEMNDTKIGEQLFLLTAADESVNFMMNFRKNLKFHMKIESDCQVAKIISTHFCSNCIATHKRHYKSIRKRYLIARADKKEGNEKILVEFILLYQQQGCKKMVESQCAKYGYTIHRFIPVQFAENGHVSLSFDPWVTNGWIRSFPGPSCDYISEESIDYYQVMGCEGGDVTHDNLHSLYMLENMSSYPPRFRIQFEYDNSAADNFEMCSQITFINVQFHGLASSVMMQTIVLKKPGGSDILQSMSPTPSDSLSTTDNIKVFSEAIATDPGLSDVLQIIATSDQIKDKWFHFGCRLNIEINRLHKIEETCSGYEQCIRMVILHWRVNNKTASWEPIAVALDEFGLSDLAHEIRDRFSSNYEEEGTRNLKYLEEAMKYGRVKTRIIKAVIQGEARSGKTSLKCLLLSLPYSKLSTGPIDAPNVAYGGSLSMNQFGLSPGKCWTLVNDEEMYDKVLAELQSITKATTKVASSTPVLHENNPHNSPAQSLLESYENESEASAELNELFEQCKKVPEKEKLSIHEEWLYFIDCGGQIQFQKLVPVFMPFASVLLLVVNLSKSLTDQASTAMQISHDQQISVSEYSLSVEEVLKQLLSAIASSTEQFKSLTTDACGSLSEYIKPPTGKLNVMAVATHRDKYDQLVKEKKEVQSVWETEIKLNEMFELMKKKCELIRNDACKILHEVDGSKALRNEFDNPVVEKIAERLRNQAYEVDVPIKWYCFGFLLRKFAKDGCGVLSLSDCQAIGRQLKIPEDEVASALKFLHILNMLLYYPDSPAVADMVFVRVESLIDIIRELVILICTARVNWMAVEYDIRKLVTKGILSVDILGKISKTISKITLEFDGFSTQLLGLFEDLLIVARLPEEDFFAPSLLPVKDVVDVNPFPDAGKSPLLFFFENAVPMGLFCAFIVYLLSIKASSLSEDDDTPINPWKIILTDDLNWSNYCILQNSFTKRTFFFVERLDCIEVHAKYPNAQEHVADVIEEAIKATIKKRKLTDRAKKAFYCKCQFSRSKKHVATVNCHKYELVCSVSEACHDLDKGQLCWLQEIASSTLSPWPTNTRSANFQEYKPDIAYSALITNTSRITESKLGLDYFATKLVEVQIITEAEKIEATNDMMSGRTESQRMDTLLDSLMATVKVDGCYFQWFIQILRDKNTVLTNSLADTLIADYNRRDHSNLYVESI